LKNYYHPAFGLSGERDPRFTFLKDINAALSSMDLVSSMRPETREGLLDEVRAELRVLHESTTQRSAAQEYSKHMGTEPR
jgi:hypothetical protein